MFNNLLILVGVGVISDHMPCSLRLVCVDSISLPVYFVQKCCEQWVRPYGQSGGRTKVRAVESIFPEQYEIAAGIWSARLLNSWLIQCCIVKLAAPLISTRGSPGLKFRFKRRPFWLRFLLCYLPPFPLVNAGREGHLGFLSPLSS